MMPKNASELCLDKVGPVSAQIEETKSFYLNHKEEKPTTSQLESLHDLMDFVYIGRKAI